jgi:hypothetical protein
MAHEKTGRPVTINVTLLCDPTLIALLTARAAQERQRRRHSPPKAVAASPERQRRRSNRKYWPPLQSRPEAGT